MEARTEHLTPEAASDRSSRDRTRRVGRPHGGVSPAAAGVSRSVDNRTHAVAQRSTLPSTTETHAGRLSHELVW